MEGHPEEDNDCEYEDEGYHPVLGLLRGELDYICISLLCSLLGVDISVLEPVAAAEVDGY